MTFADLAASASKDAEFAKERRETPTAEAEEEAGDDDDAAAANLEAAPDVHFTPVVKLDIVETKTCEEEESELFKMRAKMFRFEKESNEWKERGVGDVRLLQHPKSGKIRLVMRRDQTLKVCANHMVTSDITLRPNVGSDRSWVYNVIADVSGGEPRAELFAIRFANPDNANAFKSKFEEVQKIHESPPKKTEQEEKRPSEESPEPSADDVLSIRRSLETFKIGGKSEGKEDEGEKEDRASDEKKQ